ncbi:MAG: hypothetical protein AB8F94_23965 [Saprospiraceae bacterium]
MKKTIILLVVLFVTILSCQKKECICEFDPKVVIENDSLINLYINDSVSINPVTKIHRNKHYWNRFNEPILNDQKNESYRFSIVVLLADYFKVFRVEKKNNNYQLYAKEYAVATTTLRREDSLVSSISKEISKAEWKSVKNTIEENCFWTMEVSEKKQYLDGAGWTLEGFKNGNNCTESDYHIVYRTSPDSSSFKSICEKIIALDTLNVKNFLYTEEDF